MKGDNPLYRPDNQLFKELERMDFFMERYSERNPVNYDFNYRISNDGFFVKLVPDKGLLPASHELIKGMYITREYLHFLLSDQGPVGPKGGKVINFKNAPRYITNSEFTHFVSKGWIGTNGLQTKSIRHLINTYMDTGNALLLAVEDFEEMVVQH